MRVTPDFMPEQSSRKDARFVWAYTVEIENRSKREIQLDLAPLDHHRRDEPHRGAVRGQGVVGEQPSLKPLARPIATPRPCRGCRRTHPA